MEEHNKDVALNEWLEGQEGNYKQKCRLAFNKFMDFLKEKHGWKEVSGDIILKKHTENRKSDDNKTKYFFDDLIPNFITWYESRSPYRNSPKSPSHNFVVVQAAMVKSFFKYHREPLQVQGKKMTFNEVKKRYHAYTKDELARMVQVGDLEEKTIIMLGVQLGIRVGDFVSLKRHPILEAYKDSNGEFPLEFEIETEKEGVISMGYISREVYDNLQLYWETIPQSEYVFPSSNGRVFISEQRANDVLKNTWLKAYPERKDAKIRFHELRSYKISALTNLGVNTWAIQKMTGKKVSKDIDVYLTGVNFKEIFTKAEQALTLVQATNNNHVAVEELKKANVSLENTVKTVKEQLDALRGELREEKTLREKNNELFTKELEKQLTNLGEAKKDIEVLKRIIHEGIIHEERDQKNPLVDS